MLCIENGTIVRPEKSFRGNLYIEGEKIKKIFKESEQEEEQAFLNSLSKAPDRINAEGKLLFPGFIDCHTHFELHVAGTVTCDDFPSGTRAAISGGTTSIVDFGTQYKGESLMEGFRNWQKKAVKGASCDYGFHMSISDWNENSKKECQKMMEEGLSTFKIYMTYDIQVDDEEMFEILEELKRVGGITGVHCENTGMIAALQKELLSDPKTKVKVSSHYLSRPDDAEAEAINRMLYIANVVDTPIIDVHLTCEKGLNEIREARKRGQTVFAETCPQYLTMTEDLYKSDFETSARYVIAPPLRKKSDQEALWKALADGEIQTVCTDHCSFTLEQKNLGKEDFRKIPGGMPGVETRAEVIFSEGVIKGRITKERMCALLSENPAKLYGMYPEKGVLREDSDADIVLINPNRKKRITKETQVSRSDYAPLEGLEVQGVVEEVFLRGELVAKEGKVLKENCGKYLKRKKFQPVV